MSKTARKHHRAKAPRDIGGSNTVATPLVIDGGKKPMKVRKGHGNDSRLPFGQMYPIAPAPKGVPQMAMDSAQNAMQPIYDFAAQFAYLDGTDAWPGFAFLGMLAQRIEYRIISETRAKEMTRKGFELTYSGEDEEGAEIKLAELEKACKDFKVIDHLRIAAEHDGFYGGGHIYLKACDPDDSDEVATPLVIDSAKIQKGKFQGFQNIEPIWCYPATYNSSKPLQPHYFDPQHWYVNDQIVHKSRLLTMISREVPDIFKANYSFRGLSLSQACKPYIDDFLRTRQSVSDLLHSFSLIVLFTNLQAQLQEGAGWEGIDTRMDWMNILRDNRGSFVADMETEKLENLAVPLGTLDALAAQSQERMCMPSQTPMVKLWGESPGGLNANAEGEIRVFYDVIKALQEHLFTAPLKTMLECIQLHLWGKIDPDIGHKYVELWQLDAAAASAKRKTDADTDAVYIQEGVLSPEDVRGMLIADKDSPYAGLDPDDLPEPPDENTDMSVGGGEAKPEPASAQRSGV